MLRVVEKSAVREGGEEREGKEEGGRLPTNPSLFLPSSPVYQPPPSPQSFFLTASPFGSVELGIVHLIRSLMHF